MSDYSENLKTRAAWLYYKEGLTQDQVARELQITRTRVLRMLAAARDDGTVQIRLTSSIAHCTELERELERRYRLERAIVIPNPVDTNLTSELIGSILGEYISDNLAENITIGLGWGRTLNACLSSIPKHQYPGISVVSLLGGLTKVSKFNPSELAWRVGDRLTAESFLIAAPVLAPDLQTQKALLTHPGIREVFRRAENLDFAIVSVGDLSPTSTLISYGLFEKEEIASLERAGAIGDILCRFIDADGKIVDHEINQRVVAVDPTAIRLARKVILASGGWQKLAIMKAAIRALSPHVIMTDEFVATRLANS